MGFDQAPALPKGYRPPPPLYSLVYHTVSALKLVALFFWGSLVLLALGKPRRKLQFRETVVGSAVGQWPSTNPPLQQVTNMHVIEEYWCIVQDLLQTVCDWPRCNHCHVQKRSPAVPCINQGKRHIWARFDPLELPSRSVGFGGTLSL